MSYALKITKDKPKGLWLLNESLNDSSGNSVPATAVGSAIDSFGAALTSNCISSSRLDATHGVKFPTRLYKPGYERDSFSLEAWVFPQSSNSSILSRPGQTDGLAIVNGELRFSIRLDGSTPTILYKPDTTKTMHVVGIYTHQYMSLYVNGELFRRLNFSQDQQSKPFLAPSEDFLVAGQGGAILMQAAAIYEYALTENQIKLHYKYGRDTVDPDSVPRIYGGRSLDVSRDRGQVFLKELIGPNMSWTLGYMDTLSTNSNGQLVQQWNGSVFEEGTWLYSFDTSFESNIYSVTLGWEGEGNFVVSTSLDGVTWNTALNNNNVVGITPGSSPQRLFIRIFFPEDDNAVLSNLEIVGFKTNQLFIPNRVSAVANGVALREPWYPLEYRNDYGLRCNGVNVQIQPSTAGDETGGDHTWEYWYYANSSSVTSSLPNSVSVYQNGEPFVSTTIGSWNLIHVVSNGTTPISSITLGGDMIIGRIAAYPRVLTSTEMQNIYKMYLGKMTTPINIAGSISFSQPTVKTYSSDWSVVGSG